MYIGSISGEYSYEEKAFMCLIRFYLDPEINYYEKDKWFALCYLVTIFSNYIENLLKSYTK